MVNKSCLLSYELLMSISVHQICFETVSGGCRFEQFQTVPSQIYSKMLFEKQTGVNFLCHRNCNYVLQSSKPISLNLLR